MEKFTISFEKKVLMSFALICGIGSMLLIGQEKQLGIFAWLAPIFLLHFTRKAKLSQFVLLFVLLIGAGFITQQTHNQFGTPVLGLINGTIYAIVHLVIYLLDSYLIKKSKNLLQTLIFPSIYVIVEALVTSVIGNSGVLAQSQFSFSPMAHFSTIAGLHGITFIICWFASTFYWIVENNFNPDRIKQGIGIFCVVFVLILGYGIIRMDSKTAEMDSVKVATISGRFNLHELAINEKVALKHLSQKPQEGIPPTFFSSIEQVEGMIYATKMAAQNGAKIIVWSEAALFLNQQSVRKLIAEIGSISKEYESYILMAIFAESDAGDAKPINNKSILITNKGNIGWEYRKARPTPAEIPLVNQGEAVLPMLDTEYGRISNAICYDYDFPSLLKQANKMKVDIMLVPAYDWVGFAKMHSKMAQFETLQSGRSLIRSNGNGISMISDSRGNIVKQRNTFNNNDSTQYAMLSLYSEQTFYAKTGNWIVFVSFILLLILNGKIRLMRKN